VLLHARPAEAARAYLAERGLAPDTLERFGIGFAPNTWDAVTRRVRARGFSDEEMISAGLAMRGQRGVYDRFRGRVIIPIRDPSGSPVGIGARLLPGGEGPKYLNSPATPIFDKSRVLFGIDLAAPAIRREGLTVIVEGYTDVMAAHQAGFGNVVASLGTALTRGQVELALRYAEGIALAYDVDLAGETATRRGLLEELGPDTAVRKVRVIRVPAGKDPDELIRSDPDGWRRAVDSSKGVIDYFMDRAVAEGKTRAAGGLRDIADRVLDVLRRVQNPMERDSFVPDLTRLTGLDERLLRAELRRPARGVPTQPRSAPIEVSGGTAADALSRLELEALALLLRHPEAGGQVEPGDLPFRDATVRALAAAALDEAGGRGTGVRSEEELELLIDRLDPASAELARAVLARVGGSTADPVTAATELRTCLLRLRAQRVEEALRDAGILLRDAERDGDRQRQQEIEEKITKLGREKAEVTRAMVQPATAGGRRN
jgi:DNA primase